MNKKTLILAIAVAILIIGGVGYLVYTQNPGKLPITEKNVLNPKSCTYNIESKNITLENGNSEEEMAPGSASKITTRYFGNEVSGDFNGDGLSDIAFILTQNSGGSGTFYYAVVALNGGNGCVGTNAVFLGDRIAPQTTSFKDGEIVFNYAERKANEPMTANPSVGVSRYFKIVENKLVEIKK